MNRSACRASDAMHVSVIAGCGRSWMGSLPPFLVFVGCKHPARPCRKARMQQHTEKSERKRTRRVLAASRKEASPNGGSLRPLRSLPAQNLRVCVPRTLALLHTLHALSTPALEPVLPLVPSSSAGVSLAPLAPLLHASSAQLQDPHHVGPAAPHRPAPLLLARAQRARLPTLLARRLAAPQPRRLSARRQRRRAAGHPQAAAAPGRAARARARAHRGGGRRQRERVVPRGQPRDGRVRRGHACREAEHEQSRDAREHTGEQRRGDDGGRSGRAAVQAEGRV